MAKEPAPARARRTAGARTAAACLAALLAGIPLGAILAAGPSVLLGAAILAASIATFLSIRHFQRAFEGMAASIAKARQEKRLLEIMSENATDVIVLGDANRRRTYISPSCRAVLLYEPHELLGAHAFDLVHPDHREAVREIFAGLSAQAPQTAAVFQMRRKDGAYVWIEGRYRHLAEDGGVLAILRDISDRKHAETLLAEAYRNLASSNAILARLSQQDGLTGLTNRRHFDELLEREMARAARNHVPLGIVLLDVDCFKAFNDRYGHLAGDACLKQIAAAVQTALNRPGDLTARFGGEEFVVLLPETSHDGAIAVAEQISAAVRDLAIPHEDSPVGHITISAGAGAARPRATPITPFELIEAADQALYRSKAAGRNQVNALTFSRAPPAISAPSPP